MEINLEVTLKARPTGLGIEVEGNESVLKVITLLQMSLEELQKTVGWYMLETLPDGTPKKEVKENLRALDFKTLEAFKKYAANGN